MFKKKYGSRYMAPVVSKFTIQKIPSNNINYESGYDAYIPV